MRAQDHHTPLHLAAARGRTDVVRELLARGAALGLPDRRDGFTPLHLAVANNCLAVAEVLIAAGADPDATPPARGCLCGQRGKTARQLAKTPRMQSVLESVDASSLPPSLGGDWVDRRASNQESYRSTLYKRRGQRGSSLGDLRPAGDAAEGLGGDLAARSSSERAGVAQERSQPGGRPELAGGDALVPQAFDSEGEEWEDARSRGPDDSEGGSDGASQAGGESAAVPAAAPHDWLRRWLWGEPAAAEGSSPESHATPQPEERTPAGANPRRVASSAQRQRLEVRQSSGTSSVSSGALTGNRTSRMAPPPVTGEVYDRYR